MVSRSSVQDKVSVRSDPSSALRMEIDRIAEWIDHEHSCVGGRIVISPPGWIGVHVLTSEPVNKLSSSMSELGLLMFCPEMGKDTS